MVASDLSGDDFLLVFNSDLRSRSNHCRATGNESVPKTKTNDRIIFFSLTTISILAISNHNSFRVLFDKIASVYFI